MTDKKYATGGIASTEPTPLELVKWYGLLDAARALQDVPEINPSNYTHKDGGGLNVRVTNANHQFVAALEQAIRKSTND